MKALKWLLIIAGSVLVLVIAVLLLIPLFVDVEKYKPEIEKQVSSAVGRPFAIKGQLKLSLFPWAGVAFSDLYLGSPPGYKEKDFLFVKSFDVRMKLLPLLSKDIQVQRFVIEGPKIVLAVGTAATDLTLRKITGAPVVACLVLRTERIEQAGNAAGVSLEFPLETQFAWLQRILPQARTVGVLYNPAENQRRIDAAVQTAKRFGLRIDAEPVSSPKDVPAALNSLAKRADVLWCIPDAVTLSAVISKNILLFSFRNSIPVIGPSPAWVKAGALYSLDWDYADLGVQCGEMAVKILAGASPASVGVASPRRVQYTLNLATARQMKLDLPDALVKGARQTF